MKKIKSVAPVVKWAGGKRQLLDVLVPLLPARITSYCEPFVGGGALWLYRQPFRAYINDINTELINLYTVIRDDVESLIESLRLHRNDATYFYEIRSWDRDPEAYQALPCAVRASRLLYLNKTCYNGLFRVNSAGEFNTPFGHYKNPNIVNETTLRAVSRYFNKAELTFTSTDYAYVLESLPKGSFVYLDPPYDPVSETANFTSYTKGGFGKAEQIRLRECCDDLNRRGIRFMLSNSATDFILEQYQNYHITIVKAKRAVNSDAAKRGEIDEVVVRNYASPKRKE